MSDERYRRRAWDLADQIIRDFEEGYEQDILWEVLAQVFTLDISLIGGSCGGSRPTRPQDRIRNEVDLLFAKNQGPHYRELLYEILEEYI